MPPRPAASLTEGSIGRTLFVFSLPILASSILQSINASVNAIWIGRLLGPVALGASANANSVLFLLIAAVFGTGMAASVLVGQSLGAKDVAAAKRTVGTSISFIALVSVGLALAGSVFAPRLLVALDTPADVLPFATAYLRIIFYGLPGIYIYTFVMMCLRGAGDAKTPFAFLLVSAALDVSLNPLFIRGAGPIPAMGIAGSATATLIAQWTSLLLLVGYLYLKKHFLRVERGELGNLRLDPTILRALVVKGVPMGMQVIVVSSSALAMLKLVNRFGSNTTAAYSACFQLWSYVQMPAFAVGSAVSSMAAQNVGAGRWDRVARIARDGVLYNVLLTAVLVGLVSVASHSAFELFLRGAPEAVEIARHIHFIVSWSFILFGVSFVLTSVVRATGAVLPPLLILVVALWAVRMPFAYALVSAHGADAIWWSFPVGSVVSLCLSVAYYRFGGWRRARMIDPRPATVTSRAPSAAA
jgi:putative MATE family efflux protein